MEPNQPGMPDAYFETEEFFARMRNMNDAMRRGMPLPAADLPRHLGCSADAYTTYLNSRTDANGIATLHLGNGEILLLETAEAQADIETLRDIACGPDEDAALYVILRRLAFFRYVMANSTMEIDGALFDVFVYEGLYYGFRDVDGATIALVTSDQDTLLRGRWTSCEDGSAIVDVDVWARGWEDRLF